jgi:hypothetical protein
MIGPCANLTSYMARASDSVVVRETARRPRPMHQARTICRRARLTSATEGHRRQYSGAETIAVTVSPDGKTLYAVVNYRDLVGVLLGDNRSVSGREHNRHPRAGRHHRRCEPGRRCSGRGTAVFNLRRRVHMACRRPLSSSFSRVLRYWIPAHSNRGSGSSARRCAL